MTDDTPTIKLFGPKWDGTPVGEQCERVDTPVGATCFRCGGEISADQSGVFMWTVDMTDVPRFEPWHRLCLLLVTIGPGGRGLDDE